ncbi:MAG: radical SAM protein, partial [Nanoarchaeota archaeon]
SCNLNCIYCSVGEGKSSQKVDFVVEKDYLVEELGKLIDFVGEPVEVHIGVQGEPFLYGDLIPLIEDLQKNSQITLISMDTNFTLVGKNTIEQLAQFSKLQLNVSLDALDEKLAEVLAGCAYNLKHVQEMIKCAAKKGIKLLIAPVLVPGYNEKEMEKIVRWVKELKITHVAQRPLIGIQNFLNYKTGRNPSKAWDWQKFYAFISELEKKTEMDLKLSPEKFGIHKTKELPKPFIIDDVVQAVLKAPDRFPHTCLAVAKGRVISVPECDFRGEKKVKVKITRDKHNCFGGKVTGK